MRITGTAAVYPRWRGEHTPEINGDGAFTRFIPAGAGNTSNCCNGTAQPRGLSPLARGTLPRRRLCATAKRFIPAGAGNTRKQLPWMLRYCGLSPLARGTPSPSLVDEKSITVYPRWRGEHGGRIFYIPTVRGLSPLARGNTRSQICSD